MLIRSQIAKGKICNYPCSLGSAQGSGWARSLGTEEVRHTP